MNATATPAAGTEVPDTLAASQPRYSVVRLDGRYKVYDLAEATYTTCASRAKAEERAAKLNAAEEPAAAPLEVVTLDGTETTVLVEETAPTCAACGDELVRVGEGWGHVNPVWDGRCSGSTVEETPELSPAELAAKVAAEAEAEGRYADAREARSAELAEKVNAGEMTFDEAAALLITERGTVPAPAAAEPMRSLWVAAAFVPIILADAAPERATLVAKLDASVPNNRGGRTVRLTRAEAEELAAIGTEIENSVSGAGRMAHSARTMRDRLAALWS